MNDDICFLNATEMVRRMRRKELSAREVLEAHLAQIARLNPQVNAIVTLADGTLDAAKKAEKAVMSGEKLGPLHGVPFTVKDSIDTAGVLTQRGSPIFKGHVPDTDATAEPDVLTVGSVSGSFECGVDAGGDKVEGRAAAHGDRCAS